MERLLLLFEKTFTFDNITYLMAYCIYTGAAVLLQDVRTGNNSQEASTRLQTFTRALKRGVAKCPLLQRSLDHIDKELRLNSDPGVAPSQTQQDPTNSHSFIPAFPYYDYTGTSNYSVDGPTSTSHIATSMLDCFPEVHMDNGDWWVPST